MVDEIVTNITTGLNGFMDGAATSWALTIIIFVAILLALFIVSRNIRRFIVGAIITGILYGIYKLSRWISVSTTIENNYEPIKWFGYIVIFIIVAVIYGKIFSYTKWGKALDKDLDLGLDMDKEEKK